MGGAAFAIPSRSDEPPLTTPRMSPELYSHLRQYCEKVIKKYYGVVKSLIDAPKKTSFNDIDFLVQQSLSCGSQDAYDLIAEGLPAERKIMNGLDCTLAIPHSLVSSAKASNGKVNIAVSEDIAHEPTTNTIWGHILPLDALKMTSEPAYAQLDIRYYPSTLPLPWIHYLHSYGDLGQILGYLSYDLGLTSNDTGLHLRIQEQEASNCTMSMIFLSSDVKTVMNFLNLDKERYDAGFNSEVELFDWIRGSRTARRYRGPTPTQDASTTTATTTTTKNNTTETANETQPAPPPPPHAGKHTSDHKRRMETRPMFNKFITTILPTLPVLEMDVSAARTSLLQGALTFFDKRDEYTTKLEAARIANEDEKARVLLVKALLDGTGLRREKVNEIVRGVRWWVLVHDVSNGADVDVVGVGVDVSVDPTPAIIDKKEKEEGGTSEPTAVSSARSERNRHLKLSLREEAAGDTEKMNLGALLSGHVLSPGVEEWIVQNWCLVRDLERGRVKAGKASKAGKAATADNGAGSGSGTNKIPESESGSGFGFGSGFGSGSSVGGAGEGGNTM